MATLEYYEKKLCSRKNELEKLEKRLQRICEAEATNWRNNPYYYDEYDKTSTQKQIVKTKDAIRDVEKDIVKLKSKIDSRNIPVINEFINLWKEKNKRYFIPLIKEMVETRDQLANKAKQLCKTSRLAEEYEKLFEEYNSMKQAFNNELSGEYKYIEVPSIYGFKETRRLKIRNGKYECVACYLRSGEDAAMTIERYIKELDEEGNARYDRLVEKITEVVGAIIDAKELKMSPTGEINGLIEGIRGTAKISTFSAEGPVQRFHYRTRIFKVNEDE